MNRLIIIGNGFDRAHGLETSLTHFMTFYLKKAIKNASKNKAHNDALLRLEFNTDLNEFHEDSSLNQIIEFFNSSNVKYFFPSIFLENIINRSDDLEWLGVEAEYFELIKDAAKNIDIDIINQRIQNINDSFEIFRIELEFYLINQNVKETKWNTNFFHDKVITRTTAYNQVANNWYNHNFITFLNFNYTNTLDIYTSRISAEINVIHINGELNNNKNPIILGYGNEYDKDYKLIEELNNDKFLKYFKWLKYSKAISYSKLLNFFRKGDFEVLTVGHSLGITDKTILKLIFENPKCKHIKIFAKNEDDFDKKTIQLSRHFDSKTDQLQKLAIWNEEDIFSLVPLLIGSNPH